MVVDPGRLSATAKHQQTKQNKKKDKYGKRALTIAKIRDFYGNPVDGLEAGGLRIERHGRPSAGGRRSSTEFKRCFIAPIGRNGRPVGGMRVRGSLLGEKGRAGRLVTAGERIFLAKARFTEELGYAFRGLIYFDGVHLTIRAALSDGAARRTGEGA